jgi:peptidoglycan hydrolase-like protein with peptidoglycan-binding domain
VFIVLFNEVDPTKFELPVGTTGRGAWNSRGHGFNEWRYALSPRGVARMGSQCEKGLDYWATGAAIYAIRRRLIALGFVDEPDLKFVGTFGTEMQTAVKNWQATASDPSDGRELDTDGTVGRSDARALWTPLLDKAEAQNKIPEHYLRGQINFESGGLDPGAVGYYIWYASAQSGTTEPTWRFGGVDRGLQQNNSKHNPDISWAKAFDASWAIADAGIRLRSRFNELKSKYSTRSDDVLWQAAICSHNSPAYGDSWARVGAPPNTIASNYVAGCLKGRY